MVFHAIRKVCSKITGLNSQLGARVDTIKAEVRSFLVYKTEYPLVPLDSREILKPSSNGFLIPPKLIQTWSAKIVGKSHYEAISHFRSINPDIRFLLLDDNETCNYIEANWGSHPICDIYRSSRFAPLKADIFRYCVLYDLGGYYFDISKGCSVPLRFLHQRSDRRLLSYETSFCNVMPDLEIVRNFQHPNRYLIQWGFGFAPNDPILERVINLICAYYPYFKGKTFEDPKAAILAFTGPGMFTKAVREVVHEEGMLEGAQAGVNFNGHGIPWMQGSEIRYHLSPPYVLAQNAVIVD